MIIWSEHEAHLMVRDVFDNVVAADRFRLKVPPDLRLVLRKEKCYRSEKIFHNRKFSDSWSGTRLWLQLELFIHVFLTLILSRSDEVRLYKSSTSSNCSWNFFYFRGNIKMSEKVCPHLEACQYERESFVGPVLKEGHCRRWTSFKIEPAAA